MESQKRSHRPTSSAIADATRSGDWRPLKKRPVSFYGFIICRYAQCVRSDDPDTLISLTPATNSFSLAGPQPRPALFSSLLSSHSSSRSLIMTHTYAHNRGTSTASKLYVDFHPAYLRIYDSSFYDDSGSMNDGKTCKSARQAGMKRGGGGDKMSLGRKHALKDDRDFWKG